MSRTMRNKLFSMIDFQDRTYKSFEEILAKGKNGGQKQKLTGLLEDAQESAIHVGNTVESLYGEGTDTVSELENYCGSSAVIKFNFLYHNSPPFYYERRAQIYTHSLRRVRTRKTGKHLIA